ncbi:kinetochore-associated protein 1, partial [Elysia marginata]
MQNFSFFCLFFIPQDCAKYIAYDQTISNAQKVLAAFSATHNEDKILIFACQLKVEHAQLDDLAEFLRNMPKQTAIKCCQFVMTTAKHLSVEGYPAALAELCYNLAVSYETLTDKSRCLALLRQVSGQYQGLELLRLCRLLNLDHSEAIQTLLDTYVDNAGDNLCPSVKKILSLVSQSLVNVCLPEWSVLSALDLLTQPGTDHHQLLDVCLRLATLLATHCQPENFAEVVELLGLIVLARDICRLDQNGETSAQTEAAATWDPHLIVEKASPGQTSLAYLGVLSRKGCWSEDLVKECVTLTQELTEQGQHLLALRVLKFFKHVGACKLELSPLLRSKEGSLLLSLACSVSLPQEESICLIKSTLKSCGTDFKKLKRASSVAAAFAEVIGNEGLIESCESVKNIAKWGTRLAKIGITFKAPAKLEALDKLIKSRYCTVEIIKEFFIDFKVEKVCLETHVASYLQHYLARHTHLSLPE